MPRLWATRRVGYLLEQIRLNGENKELKDEVIALGTRFGLVTPYTSFLVTEDNNRIALRDLPVNTRRALESMASIDITTKVQERTAPINGRVFNAPVKGESGVVYSQAEKKLKESDKLDSLEGYVASVRTVGDKTFQLRGDTWIDTEFKESSTMPKVELPFGSDEFFNLISKEPKLVDFFALGKKVVVVYKGKIYKVV